MWRSQHIYARRTIDTAMRALQCSWPCGHTNPLPRPSSGPVASCGSPTGPGGLLPSPANTPRKEALAAHPLQLRRFASSLALHAPGDYPHATTATAVTAAAGNAALASTATSTPASGSAAATAVFTAAMRFRSGQRRMTPLERAAVAAHDALAEASTAAAAAAAPTAAVLPARSAVIAGAAPRRSGSANGAQRAAAAGEEEEDEEASTASAEAEAERRQAEEQRRRFVGQLQAVPHVLSSAEHLQSARKRATRVSPPAGVRNEAERERSRAARRLDTLMKELSVPLGRYAAGFPAPGRLHPFERALLALTVGEGAYVAALQRVEKLRKAVQEVGKGAAGRAAQAPNKAAATALSEEGAEAIETVFVAGARHVDALKDVAKRLRSLPSLDTSLPTLALVGAPNVGKSSLVNILSSGTPEVCNYPFTTRSIKMGHFYLDAEKHQVTDTPGLLRRPDSERNRMEQLTLAALGCLDTAVLFVLDLTQECGTSVEDQWAIRREVRGRFPDRPWIDVLSKADMLQHVLAAADELGRQRAAATDAAAAEGGGSPAPSGAAAPATASAEADVAEADEVVASAVEAASRLPAAVRISSLTHDGIPQLQLAIIRMLRAQTQARRLQQQQQRQQQFLPGAAAAIPPPLLASSQAQTATGKVAAPLVFST